VSTQARLDAMFIGMSHNTRNSIVSLARRTSVAASTFLLASAWPIDARAQVTGADSIVPTLPPRVPLPTEAQSSRITRFSFIAYGDTRGRHDGFELQAEHTLVIESMLATIKRLESTPDAIRFVVQSGDAVVNGTIAKQLTVSYIPLINRLTQEGGVPYFLSVGNHDVGGATDLADPRRVDGLRNYFAANARLIPPEGSPRRLNGYPTYGFGFGNTFFIAFDSAIPGDETQFAWVKAQLAGLDRRRYPNVALFFHHPPFSSGPHGGATIESQALILRNKWMPMFRQYHVRLLLAGHEHLFEHWVERYADASGPHRIDEIVSGGGGAPLYAYFGEPSVAEYLRAGAPEKVSLQHLARPSIEPGGNPFHYVVVHVDGAKMSMEVIAVDWGRSFMPYRSNAVVMPDTLR
jgi:3',5'-cyclic AMP phosphodiesterase CpdA